MVEFIEKANKLKPKLIIIIGALCSENCESESYEVFFLISVDRSTQFSSRNYFLHWMMR